MNQAVSAQLILRGALAFAAAIMPVVPAEAAAPLQFAVTGDAVTAPLDGKAGDAASGRRVVLDRQIGNCLICHTVPNEPEERFQGDLGPSLASIAKRLSAGQIRLRLIDQSRVNPRTLMPPYYRIDGLNRVAPQYAGRPVLEAQQIEDVVAYLQTLKD